MKKQEYDVIFSKQKELQDDIKFDDIKDSINTRVNLENKKVKRLFIVIIPCPEKEGIFRPFKEIVLFGLSTI